VVNIIEFNAGGCGLLDNLLEGKNMGGDPVRVGFTCGNDEDLTSFRLELYLTGISTMRRLTSPARSAGNSTAFGSPWSLLPRAWACPVSWPDWMTGSSF
jgi:hypothetical protein